MSIGPAIAALNEAARRINALADALEIDRQQRRHATLRTQVRHILAKLAHDAERTGGRVDVGVLVLRDALTALGAGDQQP